MRSPWTATALSAVVLTALLAAAPAGAKTVRRSVEVARPAGGAIALTALTVTTRTRPGARRPRLRLRFPAAEELPPSVRILWAKRRIRDGRKVTFAVLLMSINVAGPTARAAQDEFTLADFVIFYLTDFNVSPKLTPRYGFPSLGSAPVPKQRKLDTLFDRVWREEDGTSVFETPAADPTLDTGHYDDGHAFGWNQSGQNGAWKSLTSFTNERLSEVIAEIEANLAVDIDGDGQKGGGATIDTVIGPPVVTNP